MLWQVKSYAEGNSDIKSAPQDRQETTKGELSNCWVEPNMFLIVFNSLYACVWIEFGIFSCIFQTYLHIFEIS